jgi:branched-chain amino acid transport system substrate-binding protein
MTRMLQLFMGGWLILALTSCGQKTPEIQPTVVPPVATQKPLPPLVPPSPPPASRPVEPPTHKVGLLLPLSGPQAELGKRMLEAAELALFEGDCATVTLLPQDTAGGAGMAAQKALDQGAELLVGPVFATDVEKVKPLLSKKNINLICFSTDQNVAGGGAYILGLLPSQQIEKILNYAKEKGLTKIVALLPEDSYGGVVDKTLKRLESQGNTQILGIIHYTKGDILEGNPGNTRLIEEITNYKGKGMDALLIPEGGENLGHLIGLLGPLVSVKILGSGQWDTPETLRIKGLEGGMFASTHSQERMNFASRFQKIYGYEPPRLANLAYDAIALGVALADKGYTSQNLCFSQGFGGTEGIFRLTSEGLNERGLAVFEVSPSGFRPLNSAPEAF